MNQILNIGILGMLEASEVLGDMAFAVRLIVAALCALLSYLLGSLSSAIIISRVSFGEDVRSHGSGNAGLTNMLRTYGKGAAALTLVGDMAKTAVAVLITGVVFGFSYDHGISLSGMCYLSGVCAVLGHVYPIFYGFKGGKGVLVTATMALMLSPLVFLALILLFVIIVALSGYVSLGSIISASLLPVSVCLYSYFATGQLSPITAVSTLFIGGFIVWCHRSNIKRLISGNEKKLSIGKKEKKN